MIIFLLRKYTFTYFELCKYKSIILGYDSDYKCALVAAHAQIFLIQSFANNIIWGHIFYGCRLGFWVVWRIKQKGSLMCHFQLTMALAELMLTDGCFHHVSIFSK